MKFAGLDDMSCDDIEKDPKIARALKQALANTLEIPVSLVTDLMVKVESGCGRRLGDRRLGEKSLAVEYEITIPEDSDVDADTITPEKIEASGAKMEEESNKELQKEGVDATVSGVVMETPTITTEEIWVVVDAPTPSPTPGPTPAPPPPAGQAGAHRSAEMAGFAAMMVMVAASLHLIV